MRKALGRGLSQLIADTNEGSLLEVPLRAITPNKEQPRTEFDPQELEALAESIRAHGVLQPILLRPTREGEYEIIAGERRFRAARLAGLDGIPAVVRSSDRQRTLELALVENLQRSDISAVEAAIAYARLIQEFGLTQEGVADRVGKSRSAVANALRLLKLPKDILDGLKAGDISEGHARALLAFDSPDRQLAVYEQILTDGLSVRQVEEMQRPRTARGTARPISAPVYSDVEDLLARRIGSAVKIAAKRRGGSIQITFADEEDLTRILDSLGVRFEI